MKKQFIEKIAAIAIESMLYEVAATPKPGLVDRNDCGAHRDMDYYTFMSSVSALHKTFDKMVGLGIDYQNEPIQEVLNPLRQIGMEAERQMFDITAGVNTHKGMIFTLGILTACVGWGVGKIPPVSQEFCLLAAEMCNGVCEKEYSGLNSKQSLTKGETIYLKYGLTGVRGEVESGYETVRRISLPIYTELRDAKINKNDALIQTLLYLIANTNDTNIISRHDMDTAQYAKQVSRDVLDKGGILGKNGYNLVKEMNDTFNEHYISPGGSADLLAVTHFLYTLERTDIVKITL